MPQNSSIAILDKRCLRREKPPSFCEGIVRCSSRRSRSRFGVSVSSLWVWGLRSSGSGSTRVRAQGARAQISWYPSGLNGRASNTRLLSRPRLPPALPQFHRAYNRIHISQKRLKSSHDTRQAAALTLLAKSESSASDNRNFIRNRSIGIRLRPTEKSKEESGYVPALQALLGLVCQWDERKSIFTCPWTSCRPLSCLIAITLVRLLNNVSSIWSLNYSSSFSIFKKSNIQECTIKHLILTIKYYVNNYVNWIFLT